MMKNKLYVYLFLLIVPAFSANAQQARQCKKEFDLLFDSVGHVISFSPSVIRRSKKICPKVAIPASYFYAQLARYREMLTKTYNALSETKAKESYNCLFTTKKENGDPEFDLTKYLTDLKTLIDQLEEQKIRLKIDGKDWIKEKTCLFECVDAFPYAPTGAFLSTLFDPNYEISYLNGTSVVRTEKLTKLEYDKKKDCFYFTGSCTKIDDMLCKDCGRRAVDEISVKLVGSDPMTSAIKSWFEIQNNKIAEENKKTIMGALVEIQRTGISSEDKETQIGILKSLLEKWFPYWFWYTEGDLVVDPFESPNPENLKKLIENSERALDSMRAQKAFIDAALSKVGQSAGELELFLFIQNKSQLFSRQIDSIAMLSTTAQAKLQSERSAEERQKLQAKIKEYSFGKDSLMRLKKYIDSSLSKVAMLGNFQLFRILQDSSSSLNAKINTVSKIKDQAVKNLASRSKKLPKLQARNYLNKVDLFVSRPNNIQPQLQFDWNNGYKSTARTKRELHRTTELPDNETGVVLLHNVDSSANMKFSQYRSSFADDEEFTQWVRELLAKIDLSSIPADILTNLQNFTRSFIGSPDFKAGSSSPCERLYSILTKLGQQYAQGIGIVFYKELPFIETLPAKPLYASKSEKVKFNSEFPFKDSIVVKQEFSGKDSVMMQTFVKVGKLRFVDVALGIAFTTKPVPVTTIDTSAGGFKVSSEKDNEARAIVGIKLYPFQSYKRDRWLLPRYPLRRLSVLGGFEMLHPLDNFYVGGCYDIVPGLGFSMGANFYLKTSYKVENNKIIDTYRSYHSQGIYYSVVMNPVVVVNFVKLFFKSI
jgi:hypothetical protein